VNDRLEGASVRPESVLSPETQSSNHNERVPLAVPVPPPPPRRAWLPLAGGAALGVGLAALGLLGSGATGALPRGAVAAVNDTPISGDAFSRLVAGYESDTQKTASPEVRRRILDRMIDEELLVQRGVALGLVESDRQLRSDIVQAMIRSAVVESEETDPSDAELRAFYTAEAAFFTTPGRIRIAQLFVRVAEAGEDADALARAERGRAALAAGEALASVRAKLGSDEISPVPDALLPPATLREYVGPTVLRAALEQTPGQWGAPVRSGTGYHVVCVLEREPERTPPLEDIRDEVKSEWVRRAGDRALRGYLDALRGDARVVVAAELP
jgi:parvulin-like peptidyl-prolyl isomerase